MWRRAQSDPAWFALMLKASETGLISDEELEGARRDLSALAPSHFVEDGIEAVRVFLPKCWFDAQRCARGIDALSLYRAEYDDKRAALKPRPVHDWTSHAADALRYLAMALDGAVMRKGFLRPLAYPQLGLV